MVRKEYDMPRDVYLRHRDQGRSSKREQLETVERIRSDRVRWVPVSPGEDSGLTGQILAKLWIWLPLWPTEPILPLAS